jgi:Flp pilus assembly protein TadD
MAHFQAGRWAEGVADLRAALAVQPDFAEVWSNLAFGLRQLGRIDEARVAAERAVKLKPSLADAWNLLGLLEQDGARFPEATGHFRRALELRPNFAAAWMNLANCDQALGHLQDALARYARALELEPRHPELHYNLGHLHHKATGDYAQAIAHYRDAIALHPAYGTAHHNLSHVLFLLGQFEEAWREYAWRPPRVAHLAALAQQGRAYVLPAPGTLAGQHLVILEEQGLGDTLFFLRYAPLLRAQGATLDFAGEPRLHGMLARTRLFDRFAARAAQLERPGSIAILAGDLPLLVPEAQSAASLPAPLTLTPDPARLAAMRDRLRALGPPPYLALAWRAGEPKTGPLETLFKEVPFDTLADAVRDMSSTVVSVQRAPREDETEALAKILGRPVHDLSGANRDLEDALALMAIVDALAGVSNTNVHLRAGAGKASRVFVPFPYEWRWMATGVPPWFPGTRVYRQEPSGAWEKPQAQPANSR